MATGRLPFSASQVRRYFQRVGFQEHNSFSDLPPPTLHTVRRLIACHLQTIPFENLSLHYSTHPQIFLGDAFLFDKMVDRRKGGYCMEQNTLFAGILRTLGYDLYTIGARVYLPNDSKSRYPSGIIHMAIIVTINSVDYLVDVGFGGKGLTAPLPVFDDTSMEVSIHGVLPEEHRLSRRPLSGGNKNGALPFVLECRNNPQAGWEPLYIFQRDFELFPADYEVINTFTSQHPESLFVNNILCTTVSFNEKLEAISRTVIWNVGLKQRLNGVVNPISRFRTEEERVEAIEKWFGIPLTEEEKMAIRGRPLAVDKFDRQTQEFEF